jgi:hypothetical protein
MNGTQSTALASPITPEADPAVVSNLIEEIKRHLARFTEASKEPAASLEINTPTDPSKGSFVMPGMKKSISYLCILQSYTGSTSLVFPVDPKLCTVPLQKEIRTTLRNAAESVNMDVSDTGFTNSTKTFSALYRAVVSMAKIIASQGSYRPSADINSSLSHNLQELIRQVIAYLRRYMEVYKVTDNKMINKSYDLLYLMTIMGLMKAESTGYTLDDLDTLYQKVKELILVNTENYKQLIVPGPSGEEAQINPEIDELYRRLAKLYQDLEKQSKEMSEQISNLNTSQDKLRSNISRDLVKLGNAISQNVNSLSQNSMNPPIRGQPRPAITSKGGAPQDILLQNLHDLNRLVEGLREDMSSKTQIYDTLNKTISQYN